MNYIRINGDDNLKAECKTSRNEDDGTVSVTDVAEFHVKKPVLVALVELVDDSGEVWAMRRFSDELRIMIHKDLSLKFSWTLAILQENICRDGGDE